MRRIAEGGRATRFRTRWLILAALAAVGPGCTGSLSTLGQTVLKGPVTVEQHNSLSSSFEERAEDARSLASYHVALAARYRSSGADLGEGADDMAAHCEALANDYEAIAARYDALAAGHSAHADAPNRIQHFQDGDDRSVRDGP